MGSKNISITDEAYSALEREKRKGESFTDAILRLTQKNGRLMDCFSTWKMSDEEREKIYEKELPNAVRESTRRMRAIEIEMS